MGIGTWLLFGLAAAIGDAGADAVTKRHLTHLSPYAMGLARLLFTLPFLALVGLGLTRPALDAAFWWTVAAMVPLELAAMLMYMQALRVCHLSLCIPFLAFTPVFMILTGQVILGEGLNRWGLLGVAAIAGGSYILSMGSEWTGFWAPFKALIRERGPGLMLGVALLYSLTAAMFKKAVLHSDPAFFGVFYPMLLGGIMLGGYPLVREPRGLTLKFIWGWGLLMGFFVALSILSVARGFTLAPAAYMISVKRLSLLFSVLLGGMWLKERPFLPRLLGVILMCGGVIIIALKGALF
ncbi:MAG: EamA family transporter [Deltaproteobacteria bacterium]|nr:MAG: EamA family transporter [Deltaproteobacteria bacterium]